MQNIQINKIISTFFSFLILASFFLGFTLNENSAGAGADTAELGDLKNVWNNLELFINNSIIDAINYTGSLDQTVYKSSRAPLVYIFHKIFNPFTENISEFRKSVFVFSLLGPLLFYLCLKQKFKSTQNSLLVLISLLILLSPYFRTSAFWGGEENFGIIAALFSYLLLKLFLKEKDNYFKKKILLFLTILISSICVYFDQKLLLIPGICFFYILSSEKKFLLKISSFLIYFLFALPFIYLINLWGGIIPSSDASYRLGQIKLSHIGYTITMLAFYLFPILFFFKNKFINPFDNFLKKKENIYLSFLFFFYILLLLLSYDINQEIDLGKGYIFKISILVFNNSLYQSIFLYSAFFISWLVLIFFEQRSIINNLIIIYFMLMSIFTWPLLQEYFDPLIFILAFTFLDFKLKINYKNSYFLFAYFGIFLTGCNIYYYNLLT